MVRVAAEELVAAEFASVVVAAVAAVAAGAAVSSADLLLVQPWNSIFAREETPFCLPFLSGL